MKTHTRARFASLAALVVFGALSATPAMAQATAPARTDGRWTPYLGCWNLVVENVRNQGIEDLIRSAETTAATPKRTVCVQTANVSENGSMDGVDASSPDGKVD